MVCVVQKKLSVLIPSLLNFYSTSKQDSPTTVSSIYINIYQDLLKLDDLISKSFNETSIRSHKKNAKRPGDLKSKDRFLQDMDKIFAEKMTYLPQMIELGRKPLLSTLLKCILKVNSFSILKAGYH